MIQLTESVFAVVVPIYSERIRIESRGNNYLLVYGFPNPGSWELFSKLPKGDFTILGTVTHESIDFDVKSIIRPIAGGWYRNYMMNDPKHTSDIVFSLRDATESFRSIIQSKSITYEKLVIVERIGE